MLQPIWAMIKPFGFAVLWIWHPSEVSALSGWFDAAFSLINRVLAAIQRLRAPPVPTCAHSGVIRSPLPILSGQAFQSYPVSDSGASGHLISAFDLRC